MTYQEACIKLYKLDNINVVEQFILRDILVTLDFYSFEIDGIISLDCEIEITAYYKNYLIVIGYDANKPFFISQNYNNKMISYEEFGTTDEIGEHLLFLKTVYDEVEFINE